MKVLSEIYTYSKDKSSVVFNAGSTNESTKKKTPVVEESWFSKTWNSTPSIKSYSWFSNISLPKYKMPKCTSLNFTFPKCSFPKFSLPTVWLKSFLVKLEETRVNCYTYLVELFKLLKEKTCVTFTCSHLNCTCLHFNSNPEYKQYPWYKRVFFVVRDNVNDLVSINKGSVHSEQVTEEEGEEIYDKKGSKAKVDEERTSRGNIADDTNSMKHSQSSKYSNDITTFRNSKKLKKTNTDDLKNGNLATNIIKNTAVFSMFSKSDIENKTPKSNSPVNKSGSLHVDNNENKNVIKEEIVEEIKEEIKEDVKEDIKEENKEVSPVVNKEESITDKNEISGEKTKFNIKNTWDKFSKIIS